MAKGQDKGKQKGGKPKKTKKEKKEQKANKVKGQKTA